MSFPFVQPYFGLGNSLQTAQAAGGAGGSGIGGWVELARTTLGSNNANINISSIPDKRYYMLLSDIDLTDAGTGGGMRLGSGSADTGSNYAIRASGDGAADGAYANRVDAHWVGGYGDTPEFYVTYIANKSDKEKLVLSHRIYGATESGAGHAAKRFEFAGKWTNTSNPLDYINYYQGGSDQYASGSELVLLGWDPADTHTTNFWEELASVDWSSGDTISSGTISAKKYLWVQLWAKSGASDHVNMIFNSDTGSNYARRTSSNGGSDGTDVSQSAALFTPNYLTTPQFMNHFIINNTSKEKLSIGHTVRGNAAGAATAPSRTEVVNKWANTSNQITQIDAVMNSGNFTGGTLKVWGSD